MIDDLADHPEIQQYSIGDALASPQDYSSRDVERYMVSHPAGLAESVAAKQAAAARTAPSATTPTAPATGLYPPLTDPHEIRVAEIHAARFEDDLYCTLRPCSIELADYTGASMQEPPDTVGIKTYYPVKHAIDLRTGQAVWYTALSYVWGAPELNWRIDCNNGWPKGITRNLDSALRHFRQEDRNVILWIDQLCINQDDHDEKARQVMLMGQIYRRAWTTLVWLGERDAADDGAVETIRQMTARIQWLPADQIIDPADYDYLQIPAVGSAGWEAILRFFSRPWFTRVWTVQEAALSGTVYVAYGLDVLPMSELGMFAQAARSNGLLPYLRRGGETDRAAEAGCLRAYHIVVVDSRFGGEKMLDLLEDFGRSAATLDRDRVYAMLGLSGSTIVPDYRPATTDEEVFAQVIREIVANPHEDNRFLCCVDHAEPRPGLPSWTPDWTRPRVTTSLGYRFTTKAIYAADKDAARSVYHGDTVLSTSATVKAVFHLEPDLRRLHVPARLFDRVRAVGPVAMDPRLDVHERSTKPASETETHSILRAWMSLARECHPYPTASGGGGVFHAFWNTLVAGKDDLELQPAPTDWADIFSLIVDELSGASPALPDQTYPTRPLRLDQLQRRRPARLYADIQVAFVRALKARRFGVTYKNYMALLPRGATAGDHICVPAGMHLPFVVRHDPARDGWVLLGECYVPGLMSGEIRDMAGVVMQDLVLV